MFSTDPRAARLARALVASALGAALAAGCGEAGRFRDIASHEPAYLTNIRIQSGAVAADLSALAADFARAAPGPVEFDFDSARLDAPARAALAEMASWLLRNPEAVVAVIGHADRPGSPGYNDRIGLLRARAAQTALAAEGVARERIRAVRSLGEGDPLVATESRSRRNRRVEVRVVGAGDPALAFREFDGERARLSYVEHQARRTGFPISLEGAAE